MHRLLIQHRRLEREFKVFRERVRRQKKERRGGAREGSGHPQREPTLWPEMLAEKMGDPLGFWAFLQHMSKEGWTQNPMDARLVGALNNTFRLMGDLKGWIEKAPLQIIQAQTVIRADMKELMKELSPDEQFVVAKIIKRYRSFQSGIRPQ